MNKQKSKISNKEARFPDNFLWGTGLSAFQVEGGNIWNDWHHFYIKYEMEMGGCGGKVTDHYNRFREDFDLAKSLNQNAQRISIEWSRIEKEKGLIDQKELEHYKEELKYLKDLGFKTIVTLHHFTNPNWLATEGGWENEESVKYFCRYVSIIEAELGEYIDYWITLNEPLLYASLSSLFGKWAPEKNNIFSYYKVIKNLIKANNLSYELIHKARTSAKVGIASNIMPYIPFSLFDKFLTPIIDKTFNYYYLDKIKNHMDFVGLNYYYPISLSSIKKPKTDLNWPIFPEGIYFAIARTWKRYSKPIIITENGIADNKDEKRQKFIQDHLAEIKRAIDDNANVLGYFYWSLLDNLELTEGFWPRFGLLEIDYSNHERIVRESAKEYARICKANSNNIEISETKKIIVSDE